MLREFRVGELACGLKDAGAEITKMAAARNKRGRAYGWETGGTAQRKLQNLLGRPDGVAQWTVIVLNGERVSF
eukprot:gene11327-14485_t